MRSLPSLLILLLLLIQSACVSTAAAPPGASFLGCDVSAAYVERVISNAKGHPVVFTADDKPFSDRITRGEWWTDEEQPKRVAAPPAALVKRLERQGNLSAIGHCPSITKLLDERQIGYGVQAVTAATSRGRGPGEEYNADIVSVSVAVVSSDGRLAVLASSSVSGPLAAGGFLELLEPGPAGEWKATAFSPLWVS